MPRRTKGGLVLPDGPTIVIPRKVRKVGDLMCGAGGTFAGTDEALRSRGFVVEALAVNHCDKAIATHQANHPSVRHFTTGIDDIDPEPLVNEVLGGYVDYLMISPECTDFSPAKGGKPVNDQRRSHAHALVRWITRVPIRRCFVENVWAFTKWGPVCELPKDHDGRCAMADEVDGVGNLQGLDAWPPARPTDRCNKKLKGLDRWGQQYEGRFFWGWYNDIRAAGWNFEFWPINAADYGAPTTRVRFIGMGQRNHGGIFFPAPTHCDPKRLETERAKRAQSMFPELELQPWVPAARIINWNNLGKSLFDRKTWRRDNHTKKCPKNCRKHTGEMVAKAPNTMRRLGRGAQDHWGPIGPVAINAMTDAGLPETAPEVTWAYEQLAQMPHHEGIPILPFVLTQRPNDLVFGNRQHNVAVDASTGPAPTVTTAHGGGLVVESADLVRVVVPRQNNDSSWDVTKSPAPTATASGAGYIASGALEPVDALVVGQFSGSTAQPASENSVPTIVTIPRPQIARGQVRPADALILGQQGGSVADAAEASPAPAIATAGYLRVAQPMISPFYGRGSGETCTPVSRPVPTETTKARFGLVDGQVAELTPFIDQYYGETNDTPRAVSEVTEPLPTAPTANRFGLVSGMIVQTDNGSTPEQGRWSDGTRGVDEPTSTVTSSGAVGLATALTVPFGPSADVRTSDDPTNTVTTKDRLAVAPAILTQIDHGSYQGVVRSTDDQVPTLVTDANIALGFGTIVPHFQERPEVDGHPGQAPRIHSVDDPTPAVTSRGAGWIARPGLTFQPGSVSRKRLVFDASGRLFVFDLFFRMFEIEELAKAQGCPEGYVFIGNKEDKTRQIGNMVPPPIARAFVAAQEDADARLLIAPAAPSTATPLPAGRMPASIRNKTSRRRGAA